METSMTVSDGLYSRVLAIAQAYGNYPALASEETTKRGGGRLMVESVAFDEENDRFPGAEGLHSMQAMRWRLHVTARPDSPVTQKNFNEIMDMLYSVLNHGGHRRTLTVVNDGAGNITMTLTKAEGDDEGRYIMVKLTKAEGDSSGQMD